jgi:hypothetical protein
MISSRVGGRPTGVGGTALAADGGYCKLPCSMDARILPGMDAQSESDSPVFSREMLSGGLVTFGCERVFREHGQPSETVTRRMSRRA